MSLTLLEPFNLDTTANYTFGSANVTANIAAGNLTVTGVSNLGPVGNIIITGGSNGQVLTTNGAGNLSWTTVTGGGGASIANGTSNINIATSGGNITMGVAGNANIATVTGSGVNIAGTLNVTGNLIAGNLSGIFANGISDIIIPAAGGNIVFDVGGTANEVVVTSTGVNVTGYVTATGNITGANLTSTRIITRVANNGATTSGTITPTADTADQYNILGLTGSITMAVPSGTATDGQKLMLRIKDNGVSRSINWTTAGANSYREIGATLPTATTAGKVSYIGCIYNSTDVFWDVVAVTTQA